MKYALPFGNLAVVIAGLMITLLCPATSKARVGESRASIERRLSGAGGIVYRDRDAKNDRRRRMPYPRYLEYLPESADVRIYFKTADDRNPNSSELEAKKMPDGWDLHVVYVGGKSVIEVYKRSRGITSQEFNHLLALHAEGSYWKRLNKKEKSETVSAFGANMVRDDEKVRAKKMGGDTVLFIDADTDKDLAEMNVNDLEEKAPVSVEGF